MPAAESGKILVLIATDQMGKGDEQLGRRLLETYITTLKELGTSLWQLIFVNGGVKLTSEDSPVLTAIKEYEAAGVVVLSCGTCMEHFGLTDKKAVGGVTNMLDIVMATQNADKVITIN
ncbi:sulfurtransferase-like selenium metabolism protein YedF [candidate division KSB3 bacterium]|uniref:Sulfurtransferase-like selenium metabolism protein YedF n=1 Tax=candidate division KSB3 bacterium TaxID=2044937 RepID=A0A2G6E0V0_9BACT|nr:MAG: sulfurtransferase-like selenium metabolism protein YedF [candidate division KSB3 bacterium]